MRTNTSGRVGWLGAWPVILALAGAAGCGSATRGGSAGPPSGASGGTGGGRTAIRSVGNTHRGFVSTGHILKSDHFQMISALGPPTVAAGSSSSAHARARSGLIPNMSE